MRSRSKMRYFLALSLVISLCGQAASSSSEESDEDPPPQTEGEENGGDKIFEFGSVGGEGGMPFKLDAQMAQRVRAIIKHFKQDDPLGIPSEMGNLIHDPMPIPNLDKTFSGAKMKFEELMLHGLSKFRLEYVRVTLNDLKIAVGLSIDEINVFGNYQMSAWFSRSKGNFSVAIFNLTVEAEVGFEVDNDGILQVKDVFMDVKFGDIKMNFENLGFLGSIFQGMINSVGGFLFDSIKPMILEEVEGKVRGELNRQARSVPQQFPNSINPVDMFLASARVYMREKQLDPFPIPEYHLPTWSNIEIVEGTVEGLSTIHRTGPLLIQFEENIVRVTLHVGAENLKGTCRWRWSMMNGLLARDGVLEFTLEYLTALVKVGQPANLNKPTVIDKIDLEIGNIAVLSDGIGTFDYILEAAVNIIPNLLRKQIIDAMEDPLRKYVQLEVQKALQIEKMIEERLPKDENVQDTPE